MAKHSLDYSLFSLNHSLDPYDLLTESMERAYALVHVALLSEQFAMCGPSFIHSYLSLLADLILGMRQTFEEVWEELTNRNKGEIVEEDS